MSVRSAGLAMTTVSLALLCSACVSTSLNTVTATDSVDFECFELKQLVEERQQIFLQGFLGTQSSVFASANSCNPAFEDAVASAWRTKDDFACVVGFRCVDNNAFGRDF